jgi:hypothetical protein
MISSAGRLSDQEPAIPVGSLIRTLSDVALDVTQPVVVLECLVALNLLARELFVGRLSPFIWKIHQIPRTPIAFSTLRRSPRYSPSATQGAAQLLNSSHHQ